MFKLIFGFFLGSFITYNFIIPNPEYKIILDQVNEWTYNIIELTQEKIIENAANK